MSHAFIAGVYSQREVRMLHESCKRSTRELMYSFCDAIV